jgi:hypothetical protein
MTTPFTRSRTDRWRSPQPRIASPSASSPDPTFSGRVVATAATILLVGPGAYSLDRALGLLLPAWVTPALLVLAVIGVALSLISRMSCQLVPVKARR